MTPLRGCFVTGTDTGAGKTVLAAALCAAMRAVGERVAAFKPVVTGVEAPGGARCPADHAGVGEPVGTRWPADHAGVDEPVGTPFPADHAGLDEPGDSRWPADHVLLAAVTGARRADVCPLTFGPAVSPHLAAQLAGAAAVSIDDSVAAARRAAGAADVLVVEGVGGLLVPLSDEVSVRDLAVALGLPLVIAARPGLGTINHSLLTIESARAAGLDVRAVVLTPWPAQPTIMQRSNRDTIARLGRVEVATLAEVGCAAQALARAGAELPWASWLGDGA
ncbi:MAG TPA: dethiobiotin synthase [Solirubrobacteraceae bacterium]|nr:dethiobiotin synthase [Solirubrobacteraceae bacterium]